MFLIVGLGNPSREYQNTRHNIGFDTVDALSEHYGIRIDRAECRALTGKGMIAGQKVLLMKPQTFMNLSGEAVRAAMDYYKIDPDNEVIVISDDVSLDVGLIRIRKKGSAGGHNGLKNIILHSGTEGFKRIRIGVGEKPKEYDLADYVLGHFSPEERKKMDEGIENARKALELMLQGETDQAMNLYNRKNGEEK